MKQSWFDKIKFFVKRYWLAELVSACISYLLAWLSIEIINDKLVSSYSGSIGAFIGFYAIIYFNEYKKKSKHSNLRINHIHREIAGNLLIEFGLSEILDVLILRPACLYFAQILISDFVIAIITGNIVENIFFYALSGFMFNRRESVTNFLIKVKNSYILNKR